MASADVTTSRGARSMGRTTEATRSTETKASFKTTEMIAYVAVLAGILIAGAVITGDGSDPDKFSANAVWLYATILTFGYMVSRGLAKSGSRDPYRDDDH